MKAATQYTIRDARNNLMQVTLLRDKRLKRTSRLERLPDGSFLLRIPQRLPKRSIGALLEQLTRQLEKASGARRRRTDADLHERAKLLNHKYLNGGFHWNAIRWVSNMKSRLGSCSRGGSTDGEIRISDKIKCWPDWVVDYVIAHELMHLKHQAHSVAFWSELQSSYPLAERARGFAEGAFFIAHQPFDEEADDQ